MILKKPERTGNWNKKHQIAICREPPLEKATKPETSQLTKWMNLQYTPWAPWLWYFPTFLTSYDEIQIKSYFFRSASPLDLCNNPRQHGSGKPLIHGGESEVLDRVQLHVEFHRHLVHFTVTRFVLKPYCILLLSKQDKYYRAIKHHCYFTKRLPVSLRANVD